MLIDRLCSITQKREKWKQQPIFDGETIKEYDSSPFKQTFLMRPAFRLPRTPCSKLHNRDPAFCLHSWIGALKHTGFTHQTWLNLGTMIIEFIANPKQAVLLAYEVPLSCKLLKELHCSCLHKQVLSPCWACASQPKNQFALLKIMHNRIMQISLQTLAIITSNFAFFPPTPSMTSDGWNSCS